MVASVLSVHVNEEERALLEAAAGQECVDLGDFIRRRALEAAETQMMQRRAVRIPAKDWGKFEAWADTQSNEIAALEHLVEASLERERMLPRPLAQSDDRNGFDCGRPSLDVWFRHHAWAEQAAGVSRVHVICDSADEIVGYVTLNAAQIEPAGIAGDASGPDSLPATLLGQLAVRRDWQRKGHGSALLLFALRAALRASLDIGSLALIARPFDERMREFYRKWGSRTRPSIPIVP